MISTGRKLIKLIRRLIFISLNTPILPQAEQKRLEQEQKKQELAEKKRLEQEKIAQARQAQQKKQQAEQTVSKAPRGATISLFGFGGGDKSDAPTVSTASTAAPRGVPVISKWKQGRDGSITGVIRGSGAFRDGDPVTTSPITGKAVGGTVVTTKSGSKYFLDGGAPSAPQKTAPAAPKGSGTFSLFGGGSPAPKPAVAPAPSAGDAAKSAANARAAAREQAEAVKKLAAEKASAAREEAKRKAEEAAAAKREAQAQAKREAEEKRRIAAEEATAKREAQAQAKRDAEEEKKRKAEEARKQREAQSKQTSKKQEAQATVAKAKGGTISLFGFGGGGDAKQAPAPAQKAPTKTVAKAQPKQQSKPSAPQGVPTLSGWKLNGDGSVSGRISGSPNFRNGEQISTSPIANGRIASGEVVKTGSGSRYFLS